MPRGLMLLIFCFALSNCSKDAKPASPAIDATNPELGRTLYTLPFNHRIEEFNTIGLAGMAAGTTNQFGTTTEANPLGSAAYASRALSFADIASDPGVIHSTNLISLRNGNGENLLIEVGDTLFIDATIPDGTGTGHSAVAQCEIISNPAQTMRVGAATNAYRIATIAQFLLAIQDFLNGNSFSMMPMNVDFRTAVLPDGKVRVQNAAVGGVAVKNLSVSSSRSASNPLVGNAFSFNSEIPADNGFSDTPAKLLRPATAEDHLYEPLYYSATGAPQLSAKGVPQIFGATGNEMDLQQGDSLAISALVGDSARNSKSLGINEGHALGTATTLQDILDDIQTTLKLPARADTVENIPSVEIGTTDTGAAPIPAGAIVIRAQPGASYAIRNFSMLANNADAETEPPTDFNINAVVTRLSE